MLRPDRNTHPLTRMGPLTLESREGGDKGEHNTGRTVDTKKCVWNNFSCIIVTIVIVIIIETFQHRYIHSHSVIITSGLIIILE